MQMVYSAKNNCFFYERELSLYKSAGWDISDVLTIPYSQYFEFIQDRTLEGKMRIAGIDGMPAWGEIPPLSEDEVIKEIERQRNSLLTQASNTISIWQSELLIGVISDHDKKSLIAWIDYIKAVKAVHASVLPVKWPSKPDT